MQRRSKRFDIVTPAFAMLVFVGCGASSRSGGAGSDLNLGGVGDDGGGGGGADDGGALEPDLAMRPITPCGDSDPSCTGVTFGPPKGTFPLSSDPQPDPNEGDNGLGRDQNGWLVLGQTHASFDFLWIANSEDWGWGTVSKINSKGVKEVARYTTVTCFSNPGGSRKACDGMNGCCSRDDYTRFMSRGNGQPSGPHQSVQTTTNNPSRTAVDFNGDVWIANRAFSGQSSVTKIANDPSECTERNGAAGIQTSNDVNGDGLIDSDCNRNGVPDDVADVLGKPCNNGKPQEFYGLDDECILFTTNTNVPQQYGRPLALGNGSIDFGPADAWAGTYQDGKFFRVDGTTGQIKAQTQVANAIYGATVDAKGILWAAALADGKLRYFDTGNPGAVGVTRGATFGLSAYGITLDRDQNVWEAGWTTGHAYRYTPDRTNGFGSLGNGFWTVVNNPGANAGAAGNGRGIAADSRTMGGFFVWMARDGGWITRIDASSIPLPKGADVQVDGAPMPAMQVYGNSTIGVGVDIQQNVWGISYGGSATTRIKVDNAGTMTAPSLGGNPGAGCPVGGGDYCALNLAGTGTDARPYTYSDFTGFGLRNFTLPMGEWTYVQKGCDAGDTRWTRVTWDGDLPANTSLIARARSGQTPTPDQTWGSWTGTFAMSPGVLDGVLAPNAPAKYLQIKFVLSSQDKLATPKLKDFTLWYECQNVPQ